MRPCPSACKMTWQNAGRMLVGGDACVFWGSAVLYTSRLGAAGQYMLGCLKGWKCLIWAGHRSLILQAW